MLKVYGCTTRNQGSPDAIKRQHIYPKASGKDLQTYMLPPGRKSAVVRQGRDSRRVNGKASRMPYFWRNQCRQMEHVDNRGFLTSPAYVGRKVLLMQRRIWLPRCGSQDIGAKASFPMPIVRWKIFLIYIFFQLLYLFFTVRYSFGFQFDLISIKLWKTTNTKLIKIKLLTNKKLSFQYKPLPPPIQMQY